MIQRRQTSTKLCPRPNAAERLVPCLIAWPLPARFFELHKNSYVSAEFADLTLLGPLVSKDEYQVLYFHDLFHHVLSQVAAIRTCHPDPPISRGIGRSEFQTCVSDVLLLEMQAAVPVVPGEGQGNRPIGRRWG